MSQLVTVNDAHAKLKFLASDRTASERGNYAANWSGFAKRIAELRVEHRFDTDCAKNYRNTLESSAKNNKIDSDTERIVAELCRLNASSPNWRSGTLAQFKAEYQRAQFRILRHPEWSISNAISVTLMFPEQRAAASWPFDVDVVCQKATIDVVDQSIAVSRAVLQIIWDASRFPGTCASRPDERQKRIDSMQPDFATRNVQVTTQGGPFNPEWVIESNLNKTLGIVPFDSISELAGLASGLEVEARLTVFDKDLNVANVNEPLRIEQMTSAEASDTEESAIRRADGQPLGVNKKAVLKAIAIESLKQTSNQPPGSAIFACCRITFEER